MTAHHSKRRKLNPVSQVATKCVPNEGYERNPVSQKVRSPQKSAHDISSDVQGNAYHTNLLHLKVEELLAQVRPDYRKRTIRVERAIRKLQRIIEEIPNRNPISALEAEETQLLGGKVRIPFPEPRPKDVNYNFSYGKPSNISVVGSYARKTAVQMGDQLVVDLTVTIPKSLFQEKDYLNYRYFHKRAYYLACIATGICEDATCCFILEYSYQNDNPLQPAIVVNPSSDGGEDDFRKSKCTIRILLAADASTFPLAKTMPDKSCIRASGDGVISCEPTPLYNATLRSECSSLAYARLLHSASVQSAAFNDVCVLGSVWLRQRGFGTGLARGGYGPFEWACTVSLLMQNSKGDERPVLSSAYSSYQMFKATLQYLSTTDLVRTPAHITSDHFSPANVNGPILFDPARGLNILFKMTLWSYSALKDEAKRTLQVLSDQLVDQFDGCFIRRVDNPVLKYDYLLRLPIEEIKEKSLATIDAVDGVTRICQQIYLILRKGLGDRARLIDLRRPQLEPWPLDELVTKADGTGEILVGLFINPENYNRTVDKGPLAQEKEAAAEFRTFWGEKAELRRFKDGSILESLVWQTSSTNRNALSQVIIYLIRRYFGNGAASCIKIISERFSRMLPEQKFAEPSNSLTLRQPLSAALDTLQKQIRNLEGLPLQIRQVIPADPSLRFASVGPPSVDPADSGKRPANVYVQFEGSNRWPDDFEAVQRTKIAFLLKMGELLEDSDSSLQSRLGLEKPMQEYANIPFLDVIRSDGASFRIRIHHEREQSLIERRLKSPGIARVNGEAAACTLRAYKRNFIQIPRHTQAVRTLSTRFSHFPPSIQFMRRWRDCHLLSRHISDELIELLTIHSFLHPGPYDVPGSSMTGFLRTITFISKWNWRAEPFITDIEGEMSAQDIDAINTRFKAWRKIDPAMNRIAMFAASNISSDGVTWTDLRPSKVVAARFTSLAQAAAALVNAQGLDLQAEILFTPNLTDYDFLIRLDPAVCQGGQEYRGKQSKYKNLQAEGKIDTSLLGFDPVQSLLEELEHLYGSNVVFFHNAEGGDVIGGLWNPQTGPRSWKLNVGYSTSVKRMESEDEMVSQINKIGTLNDIARLGGDMVRSIESIS